MTGTVVAPLDDGIDGFSLTFGHDLDRPIGEIADPSRNAMPLSLLATGDPKSDALYLTTDDQASADGVHVHLASLPDAHEP